MRRGFVAASPAGFCAIAAAGGMSRIAARSRKARRWIMGTGVFITSIGARALHLAILHPKLRDPAQVLVGDVERVAGGGEAIDVPETKLARVAVGGHGLRVAPPPQARDQVAGSVEHLDMMMNRIGPENAVGGIDRQHPARPIAVAAAGRVRRKAAVRPQLAFRVSHTAVGTEFHQVTEVRLLPDGMRAATEHEARRANAIAP